MLRCSNRRNKSHPCQSAPTGEVILAAGAAGVAVSAAPVTAGHLGRAPRCNVRTWDWKPKRATLVSWPAALLCGTTEVPFPEPRVPHLYERDDTSQGREAA